MCRNCRTFRKSYPFGGHAATNRPKSTLKVLAFLDFWLTGYRCSGRFLWMSGHFWSRSVIVFEIWDHAHSKYNHSNAMARILDWVQLRNWNSQIINSENSVLFVQDLDFRSPNRSIGNLMEVTVISGVSGGRGHQKPNSGWLRDDPGYSRDVWKIDIRPAKNLERQAPSESILDGL